MAKVYKIEMYITDPNDQYSDDEIIDILEYDNDLIFNVTSREFKNFDWSDEVVFNYNGLSKEDYHEGYRRINK